MYHTSFLMFSGIQSSSQSLSVSYLGIVFWSLSLPILFAAIEVCPFQWSPLVWVSKQRKIQRLIRRNKKTYTSRIKSVPFQLIFKTSISRFVNLKKLWPGISDPLLVQSPYNPGNTSSTWRNADAANEVDECLLRRICCVENWYVTIICYVLNRRDLHDDLFEATIMKESLQTTHPRCWK